MTTLVSANAAVTDADLIAASRRGDRGAFGQIVRKYQAMISGLIYAACGDLHRSEDVAQETFISAWKSLSGLRDSSKLPGWLCQIARRRLADLSRKSSPKEIQFSHAFVSDQESPTAPDNTPTAEELELLWRTLARIPQPYRETLVLYYRQDQSTAQVAAAMETTEAAVRQRLSRGRQILRDEVASVLERNLARTSPTPQFTMQVVAALPMLAAQTAGLGATAKGVAAIKGGGALASIVAWATPLTFFLGLIFGTVQDVRLSKSPRQRRVNLIVGILMWTIIGAWVIGLNLLVSFSRSQRWDFSTIVKAFSASACLFGICLFSLIVFGRWQMEKILRQETIAEPAFPTLAIWQRLLFTAPVVTVCLAWMARLALTAGDQLAVDVIVGVIFAQSLWFAWRLPALQPHSPIQQTFETLGLALIAIVIIVNWRMRLWFTDSVPLASINLAAMILSAWMGTLWALNLAKSRGRCAAH